MRVVRNALLAGCLALTAQTAGAQTEGTLADIRQELSILFVELQRLNRELSTTGNPSVAVGGATALDRIARIEAELRRLTAATEALDLRVNTVVRDGTNRVGDLEFRLCELEPDCDIADLGETPRLGGELPPEDTTAVVAPSPIDTPGAELALGEQRDFDAAQAALSSGDYAQAAALFRAFTETYTGGPLNAEAHFLRGEALAAQGNTAEAGRAYLDSFSGAPDGPIAPDALLQLGITLNALGQANEACVMLSQVSARFPGSPQAAAAATQLASLGCS